MACATSLDSMPPSTKIARVLRPGGRLLSLDFNRPSWAPIRFVYLVYLTLVGSALGWVLHGDPDTYRYIPESIRRYPGAHGVADRLRQRGFADVRVIPILGGFMTLHVARKAPRTNNGRRRTKNSEQTNSERRTRPVRRCSTRVHVHVAVLVLRSSFSFFVRPSQATAAAPRSGPRPLRPR